MPSYPRSVLPEHDKMCHAASSAAQGFPSAFRDLWTETRVNTLTTRTKHELVGSIDLYASKGLDWACTTLTERKRVGERYSRAAVSDIRAKVAIENREGR